ncbi:class I SAM-dependent methyltransferase [Aurantibacter sp.]|uniref:O-methyltransferase n=1 Tax=Aurantibacter sp. TaxID=2807103 RepID=UPI003266D0FB
MITLDNYKIEDTLEALYNDAKNDQNRILRALENRTSEHFEPIDFKDAYLAISRQQGEHLKRLIKVNNVKNIVEFGTSFGISTLFLAQGVQQTGGKIITTELIESKAHKAIENFKRAGVEKYIEVRIGNAMDTLKNYTDTIDLLLLDGWKDLYLPLFQLLEPNFTSNTIIYVDNAEMSDTQVFLRAVSQNPNYIMHPTFGGKAVLIHFKKENNE